MSWALVALLSAAVSAFINLTGKTYYARCRQRLLRMHDAPAASFRYHPPITTMRKHYAERSPSRRP